jgi:hypothetical protein
MSPSPAPPASPVRWPRRRIGVAAIALLTLLGTVLAIDHLQRQPSGPMLQASAAPWVWDHTDFGIQLDSLRLVANDQATLLTGAFSRSHDAPSDSLPPGALLETQWPDWVELRQQRLLQQLPGTGGTLQGQLLQEALREAVQQSMSTGDATLALHWLPFTDRQFIAPLGSTPQLQITASLGQEPLLLQPGGTPSTWQLGANTKGTQIWSQPTFISQDQGVTWTLSSQQMSKAIDQQVWVTPQIGVAWQRLEHALLLTHDSGQTWAQPRVETPLTMAAQPATAPTDDAPAMVQAWRERTTLHSLDPFLWGDQAHDPAIDARYETLLTRSADGQIRGWTTRWTRTLQHPDSTQRTYGEWLPALTRRFGLDVRTPGVARITDIQTDAAAPAIDDALTDLWMTAADGNVSLQRDRRLHYLDAATGQWQAPVTLPHRSLQAPFLRTQVWVGRQTWISHAASPSLLDMAACLLPRRMAIAQRCHVPSAHSYYASRDQGRTWTPFQLPENHLQRIVGWDEHAQSLLVASAPSASKTRLHHQLQLTPYALPE